MQFLELIEGAEYSPGLVDQGCVIRAYIAWERDMPDEAEALFLKIVRIRQDVYGTGHTQTLSAISELAVFYYRQDLENQSEQLLKDVLEVRRAMSAANHPATLDCMLRLSVIHCSMERYVDALRLYREVYAAYLELFDPNHTRTITTLFSMSTLYSKEGKYDEGLELGSELLDRCIKFLPPEDGVTMQIMSVLSSIHEENGCVAEAEAFKTKVLDYYRRMNLPQNPRVARELTNLCSFYERQEKYKKAEPLREQVVGIETGRVGGKSPEAILAMCELGINYSYQGLHNKASKYQYKSLQLPLKVPKYKSLRTISRMLSIADEWVKNGNISDGEKMARDATAAARKHIGLTHATTISAITGLAGVCFDNYGYEEAETLYREALALRSRFPKPEVARNITDLAWVLSRRGYLAEAESEALQAKEIISAIPKARNPLVTFNKSTFADIYEGQGRYSEAEGLYSDILTLRIQQWETEKSTRSSILGILKPLEDLAFLYWQTERNSKAENILSKTISIRRKLKDPTHIDTLLAVASLCDVYISQERFTEALTLLLEYKDLVSSQGLERDDKPFRVAMAHIQHGIAKSYIGQGKYDDAESFARLALSTSKEICGENNRFTLRCESIFAPIYRGKGSLEEAADVEIRMADAWAELLGQKNLNIIASMQSLAKTRAELGQSDEARKLEDCAAEMRKGVDFGLDGQKEKAVEELVETVFRKWEKNEDGVMAALERLSLE